MGTETKIQWCDHTFNPWRGCEHARMPDGSEHPGCANCYAEAMAKRNPKVLGQWGPRGTRVVAADKYWHEPARWNRAADLAGVRRRVFCESLSDVFEGWPGPMHAHTGELLYTKNQTAYVEQDGAAAFTRPDHWTSVPTGARQLSMDDVRARLFALIDATPNLDWLLVTKRPENVRRMWGWCDGDTGRLSWVQKDLGETVDGGKPFRRNVWLLTSISDQQTADTMIPELLKCRNLCPVLGLSAEPLLGPVDLFTSPCRQCNHPGDILEWPCRYCKGRRFDTPDWVIIGGESGPDARPCNVAWIRDLVGQCKELEVPAFVKQLGALPTVDGAYSDWPFGVSVQRRGDHCEMILEDDKGGDPEEWPEDLRVREFPEVQS